TDDQPGAFRQRNELVGSNPLAVALAPAQQRLDAYQQAVLQAHLRLVDKEQLLLLEGFAQLLQQAYTGMGGLFHGSGEMVDAATLLLLAVLERDVGGFQGIAAAAVDLVQAGQANGGGDVLLQPGELQGLLEKRLQVRRIDQSIVEEDAEDIAGYACQQGFAW